MHESQSGSVEDKTLGNYYGGTTCCNIGSRSTGISILTSSNQLNSPKCPLDKASAVLLFDVTRFATISQETSVSRRCILFHSSFTHSSLDFLLVTAAWDVVLSVHTKNLLPATGCSFFKTNIPSLIATVSAQAIERFPSQRFTDCQPSVSLKQAQCLPISIPIPKEEDASPTQATSTALGEGISGRESNVPKQTFHSSRSCLT